MITASHAFPIAAFAPLAPRARAPSVSSFKGELPPPSIRGRVLANRYLTEEILEERAFSVRYRAYDMALNENVCVEFFPRSAMSSWNTVRQAVDKLAALGHPQIVEVVGRGMLAGAWPFLVTESTEGAQSLRALLAERGALDLPHTLRIGILCAKALGAAHGAGVTHAAFCPERALSSDAGGLTSGIEIGGLGLSPLVRQWHAALLGSAEFYNYVAPEQIESLAADARSDVYALGAVLYELATGTPVFAGDAAQVLEAHLETEPEPPSRRRASSELPFRAFDKILARCLAKSPAQRYPSMASLAVDLQRLDAAMRRASSPAPHQSLTSRAAKSRAAVNRPASGPAAASRARTQICRAACTPTAPTLHAARLPPQKSRVGMRALPKVIVNPG